MKPKPRVRENLKKPMLTAGGVLKARRLELGKSLEQISLETKIQLKYLAQIEADQHYPTESEVFISGFIKIYAAHIQLDVEKVLALYRRSKAAAHPITHHKIEQKNFSFGKLKDFDIAKYLTPKNSIALITTVVIISILLYLSAQFYNFQKDPLLEIVTPTNNTISKTEEIVVEGKTEEDTIIEINGKSISLENNSTFQEKIILKEGNNTVTVRAIKKSNKSQETLIILNVKYEKEDLPEVIPVTEEEAPVTPEKQEIQVEVSDEAAWIQLTVDGKQELAQIVSPPFSQKFEVESSFFISTGRPTNTKLFINNIEKILLSDSSGTASLTCEFINNQAVCQ